MDQVVVPIGRRGGEEPGEEGMGAQSGSSGRGRSWTGAGRLRGGRATREAATVAASAYVRVERGEALEEWQGARTGEVARHSRPGEARPATRQSPLGKVKGGEAKTLSRSWKWAVGMRTGEGADAQTGSGGVCQRFAWK